MSGREGIAADLAGIEVHGVTRGAFILRGALAVGGAYGLGAVGPYVERALGQVSQGDVDVIRFALTLEYVEAAFYKAAIAQAKLSGEVKKLAAELGGHEEEHVTALSDLLEMLGAKAPPAPKATFQLRDERSFLRQAGALETTGVGAYNGAAPRIQSGDVLGAAGSIVQVEARHAAAVRQRAGQDPSPQAFDRTVSAGEAQAAVQQYVR